MKHLKTIGQAMLLAVVGLISLVRCTEIQQPLPKAPVDTTSAPLPQVSVTVSGQDSADLDFSGIIKANEPFSLSFGAFQHGKVVLRAGNVVRYISTEGRWKADSGYYDYCQKGNCRRGKIKVGNNNHTTTDTIWVQMPNLGPFYATYLGSVEVNLIPPGRTGKIISMTHSFFTAQIVAPDSVKVLYFAGGGGSSPFSMGFDDIRYQVRTANDTIFYGTVPLVLGDTCEAQARDDAYTVLNGQRTFLPEEWAVNDEPCFAPLENYRVMVKPESYTGSLRISTPNGTLSDTLIGAEQRLVYRRQNQTATQDTFLYYLLDMNTNRLSRAYIRLTFN